MSGCVCPYGGNDRAALCCFPNCLPEADQEALAEEVVRTHVGPPPRPTIYQTITEVIIGVVIAALMVILIGTYVFFVGFGIQCNGRGRAEFHAPIMYECWIERIKK
jgi:hypothetical protein